MPICPVGRSAVMHLPAHGSEAGTGVGGRHRSVKKRSPDNKLKLYLQDMIFRFTIIVFLVTSAMASCRKNDTVSAHTGFYGFKEKSYERNTTNYTHWTFDSVEVYEPVANTLALRHIFNGQATDSVKFFTISSTLIEIGAFFPYFIIDPGTNIITDVHNIFPDDGRNRQAFLDTGFISRYDAAARTYYLHYFMKQNGRHDLIFHDTLIALP